LPSQLYNHLKILSGHSADSSANYHELPAALNQRRILLNWPS
jgi:hypothetical protein